MKRGLSIFLFITTIILCVLPGSNAADKKDLVGFTVASLSDPFVKMIADGVADRYKKDLGVKVVISSCEYSQEKQVEQLENFAAMGCRHILCMSMNSPALGPVVNRVRAQGVSVMLIGANPPNYTIDGCVNVNQADVGKQVSMMAIHWLDQKYPKAAPGSVHVAVFTTSQFEDLKTRGKAIKDTINADPRIKIVFEKENVMEITEGQQGMEEAFAKDHDIKLVLAWNDAIGIGCNNAAMSEKGIDKGKFAIFSSAVSEASIKLIDMSKKNGSVFRGTIKYGADDVPGYMYGVSKKIYLKEVPVPYIVWDPIMTINSVGYKIK